MTEKTLFDLKELTTVSCEIQSISEQDITIRCDQEGGYLCFQGLPGHVAGVHWEKGNYLVFDAENLEEWTMALMLHFWQDGNTSESPDLSIRIGLIPGLKTRIALPLTALNGQHPFLPRTPGKVKTVVIGNKIELRKISQFALGTKKSVASQAVCISDLHIGHSEPEYPLPDRLLVDELGQLKTKYWSGKTKNAHDLVSYLRMELASVKQTTYPEDWSEFGGWQAQQYEATGFFRTQYADDRWWLVDPLGHPFFSVGLDCVHPGEGSRVDTIEKLFQWLPSPGKEKYAKAWSEHDEQKVFDFTIANLIRAFGEQWKEKWTALTRSRIIDWGFNTVANWSDPEFYRYARIPYVLPLANFPTTKTRIFEDFPDVFSPEYQENADLFAQQLKEYRNDPYLIGYFLRNEPHWTFVNNLNIAEKLLETDNEFHSKDELVKFLRQCYQDDIASFNRAWNVNLSNFDQLRQPLSAATLLSATAKKDLQDLPAIMIERYVAIPSRACKQLDSNHLNLGMRYARISSPQLISGHENFDVFSINCYQLDPSSLITRVGDMINKPIMIGEFHFGALDRGLLSNSLRGVRDQTERGIAYRYYVENAAAHKYCVGTHYFALLDQGALGRFDGENNQLGFVDICHRPYQELVDEASSTNRGIYQICSQQRDKSTTPPIDVPSNVI